MYYFSPSVKQCLDRKGKPWRATVYYKDPETGKSKQKTKVLKDAKGKKEAEKMARLWMDELNNQNAGKAANPEKWDKTVDEVIKEYEDFRLTEGIEKSTYKRDLLITKNYISPYLGDYLFTSVNRDDLRNWLKILYNKHSQTTTRNAYTQLKKVYTYYYDYEMPELGINPFKGVKAPKQGKPRKTHLTNEQRILFLAAVNGEYEETDAMYCGLLLAFYCGLRRGEICGLRWRNVDFDKEIITIDSSIGYADGGNYTKSPKTTSSNRTINIVPQLYEALKKRYDFIKPESHWFVVGNKDKFMSLQSFTSKFQKFADAYELTDYYGERITPHGLRHNYATMGIEEGIDIASLSALLGHASRAMTLDVYGDADADAVKMASEKMALKFGDIKYDVSDEVAAKLNKLEKKHRNNNDQETQNNNEPSQDGSFCVLRGFCLLGVSGQVVLVKANLCLSKCLTENFGVSFVCCVAFLSHR